MTPDKLRLKLKERGTKQIWIAEQLAVSKGLVSQWINGTTPIAEKHMKALRTLIR